MPDKSQNELNVPPPVDASPTKTGLPPMPEQKMPDPAPMQPAVGGAAPAAPKAVQSDGSVTLSKQDFDALMARIAGLETTQGLMLKVEDKNKIMEIERLRASGKLVKSVKVRRVGDKYVIGWRTLEDDVYMQEGKLIERQRTEVFFKDGEKKEYFMRDWTNAFIFVPFEVTRESKDENGEMFFTVRHETGETFEINIKYVN